MTTFFYKDNKKVTLDPDKREAICSDINEMFKRFYKDVEPSVAETEGILKGIYPDTMNSEKMDKVPDLYEQYKTYTSAIQRACYPEYKAIVDIEGLDLQSNSLASAYKSSLIYDWYNIDLMKTLDKVANDWAIKGEGAFYVCWREEVYQKTSKETQATMDPLTGDITTEVITVKEDIPVFQAVDVKHVNPHQLYFDKSQVDDWDNCRKIYRDFMPIEKVLACQEFNLTAQEKKELKELVKSSQKERLDSKYDVETTSDTKVYGSTVEVLEFEGTYVLPDSCEILRRVEATVIAGKYLARFQESDKPKSPYIWASYLTRPDTGRGQSPLKIPQILNAVENMCMDLTMACFTNTAVPVFLAPKGAFNRAINVVPGKPIEYDPMVLESAPTKLDFSAGLRGFEFNNYLKNKMEAATGITQYMQGSQDGSVRTASEASYIHSGATMRMSREAFLFTNNLLQPLVRLYALYKKIFDTVDREVRTEDGEYVMVGEAIRNGNYRFLIGGSQSVTEREAETKKIFEILGLPVFQSLASIMDPMASAELLKWILNRLNLNGTEQIIQMLSMNQSLRKFAEQQGIQSQNIPQFISDTQTYMRDNAPVIGQQMLQQMMQQGGQQ